MSFTAPHFYLLLVFAFVVYWAIPSMKIRRRFLVAVSFFFYAIWNVWFFSLLVISTSTDFFLAKAIYKSDKPNHRKLYLFGTLAVNFGILAFFKYFNFFSESFSELLKFLGFQGFNYLISVMLPLGISFYTFHTVSYTIDVYRKKYPPIDNFWDYFLFVCYFPQLVAGPIARVNKLYPQFFEKREISIQRVADGILMICFGLFMKFLIADNLGAVSDHLYSRPALNAALGWTAVFSFGFQIYVDFWSYTLIARGSSHLFAIELNPNFEQPYLSLNPTEFWRRWHMSLSSWFRDYLYIPLGGNQSNATRNILITMTVAGLWHGSSLLFVFWGFYHGVLLVVFKKVNFPKILSLPLTFLLVNVGWILFRSQNLAQAKTVFTSLWDFSAFDSSMSTPVIFTALGVSFTLITDILFRFKDQLKLPRITGGSFFKLSFAGLLLLLGMYLGESGATPFIYFNF